MRQHLANIAYKHTASEAQILDSLCALGELLPALTNNVLGPFRFECSACEKQYTMQRDAVACCGGWCVIRWTDSGGMEWVKVTIALPASSLDRLTNVMNSWFVDWESEGVCWWGLTSVADELRAVAP